MTACFKSRIMINSILCIQVPLTTHNCWKYEWLNLSWCRHSPKVNLADPWRQRQPWIGTVQATQPYIFFPIQSMEEGPGRCLCWIPQAVTGPTALQNVRFPVCPGLGKSHSKFVTALSFPHHRQHRRKRPKEHSGRVEIKDIPVAWFTPLPMKLCDLNYMSVSLPCQKDKWIKMKGISEQLWERRHYQVFGCH